MTVVEVGLKGQCSQAAHARELFSTFGEAFNIRDCRGYPSRNGFDGIDSGPAHLANAMGTYGIIILGRYMNL
jgi:heptosyltransferase-3